ncbi:hypothetical protein [Ketogulonicigenium vulgare]|uniref:hypothetical protein n=1 Tax=Ketogulonicigenium vulgare TaxID=92945 RepID=UPI0023587CF0|nr:hypothetical protein [Ketogulonicigenium vulgare]
MASGLSVISVGTGATLTGDRELIRSLTDLSDRDLNIAATWALNDTAADVLTDVQQRMGQVFDRPTPFALNAFQVRKARPNDLQAAVQERPSVGKRHFLKVQELGGVRPQTGLERNLGFKLHYEGHLQTVTPGPAALLDARGNWSTGERNRVLSGIRAQSDKHMNSKRGAAKVKRRNAAQFFVPRAGSKLSPGVWKRTSRGAKLQKVLNFTDRSAVYKPRLKFLDGAEVVASRQMPLHLRRTLAQMVAKRAVKV